MTTHTTASILATTLEKVSEQSYFERNKLLHLERAENRLLDKIIDIKSTLNEGSVRFEMAAEQMEKVTWFVDIDEDDLRRINEIIILSRDACTTAMQYISKLSFLRKKGLLKQEVNRLKSAIADTKEVTDDLEDRFFTFPNDPEFVATTHQLSLLK